jgi:hypothetical protein
LSFAPHDNEADIRDNNAMYQILLGSANVFVLIICLIGVQSCYFRANWKWFWLMLVCVVLSGASAFVLFYGWFNPESPASLPRLDRSLVNPL